MEGLCRYMSGLGRCEMLSGGVGSVDWPCLRSSEVWSGRGGVRGSSEGGLLVHRA